MMKNKYELKIIIFKIDKNIRQFMSMNIDWVTTDTSKHLIGKYNITNC